MSQQSAPAYKMEVHPCTYLHEKTHVHQQMKLSMTTGQVTLYASRHCM